MKKNFINFSNNFGTFSFVKISKLARILNSELSIELFKNLGYQILKPIDDVSEEDLHNKIERISPSIPCTTPFVDYRKEKSTYFNCSTRLKSFKTIIEFLKIDNNSLKEDEVVFVLFLEKQ